MTGEHQRSPAVSVIKVVVDAQGPDRLAAFWVALLGYSLRQPDADDAWRHLEPPHAGLPPLTI
jgi:Glyoxalase-like domain